MNFLAEIAENNVMVSLEENIQKIKKKLKSEDVMVFEFSSDDKKRFAAVFVDGICDKELLGELVIKPLKAVQSDADLEQIKSTFALSEVEKSGDLTQAIETVMSGDCVLYVDGEAEFFTLGLRKPPIRTISEPPTEITVKGPREGFIEDIKTNLSLIRRRIKSDKLQIKTISVGKRSKTSVAIVYIDGIVDKDLPKKIEKQISKQEIDIIPDSSYISNLIADQPRSLFKQSAGTEKPDKFCAKLCEGRVGVVVDGSPIALTVPYMLVEDFQTSEDYYITSYRATILRMLRIVSLILGLFLPALYISAQLFKLQILPLNLVLKISSSTSDLPLSPSVELFLVLLVLEILNEASIRMPKFVGLALSIVGALVLGDTAVKAGIISTPAIIIIAFSAICLYTVPDLTETTTTLRWLYLIIAGSIGTFGIVVFSAFLLCYLVEEQSYGVPLMAPFAPLVNSDMYDAFLKVNMLGLRRRPKTLKTNNKVRLS